MIKMNKIFSKRSQLFFIHELGILLSTNISMLESLEIIYKMEKDKKRKHALQNIVSNIKKGISLSNSLINKQLGFNNQILSIIQDGELSGTLSISLNRAYLDMERKEEIKKKIISALIYPGFIFIATIAMSLFLVMFIFPKIFPLLNSLNVELPLLTRLVSGLYKYIIHYGLYTLLSFVLILPSIYFIYKKYQNIQILFLNIIFNLPILGDKVKKFKISNHFYSVSLLLEHGQSLSSILQKDFISENNIVYKQCIKLCSDGVIKGLPLSICMNNFPNIYPSQAIDMVSIGERTGNLYIMLNHIAKIFELEIEDFIKRLSVTIEPLLMIFMGLIVGSIALSIILPIYEVTNHLQK